MEINTKCVSGSSLGHGNSEATGVHPHLEKLLSFFCLMELTILHDKCPCLATNATTTTVFTWPAIFSHLIHINIRLCNLGYAHLSFALFTLREAFEVSPIFVCRNNLHVCLSIILCQLDTLDSSNNLLDTQFDYNRDCYLHSFTPKLIIVIKSWKFARCGNHDDDDDDGNGLHN